MKYRILLLTAALIGCATLARAQQPLRLQIAGGRVTLHAQNVPLRTILTEWARLGGAKIVNGDRVAGAPITVDLEDVPERQALDILLRSVSGYLLAAREPGAAGASMYDRIMILPTSAAPRTPPPTTPPGPGFPNPQFPNAQGLVRPIAPRVPDEQDGDDDPNAGLIGTDNGLPIPRPNPITVQRPPNGVNTFPLPPIGNPEEGPNRVQQQPGVVGTPANPFGLPPGSSITPGVISPPPPATIPAGRNGQAN